MSGTLHGPIPTLFSNFARLLKQPPPQIWKATELAPEISSFKNRFCNSVKNEQARNLDILNATVRNSIYSVACRRLRILTLKVAIHHNGASLLNPSCQMGYPCLSSMVNCTRHILPLTEVRCLTRVTVVVVYCPCANAVPPRMGWASREHELRVAT